MTRLFTKHRRTVGLPPGSLQELGTGAIDHLRISITEYSTDSLVEKENATLEDCLEHLGKPTMSWIQVFGISDPSSIAAIGKHFKLHPLAIEDILTTGQRSKLDVYQDQVFIIVRLLQYIKTANQLKDEQISIVFGPNYTICFQEQDEDVFKPIRERFRKGGRLQQQGPDYLAYALLDTIVDYYFVVLEDVDTHLDHLEEELMHYPKPGTIQQIQKAKRDMIVLRKAVWPMRDVLNRFIRLDPPMVSSTTQVYLHDIYDHTVQTIDIIEGFRDVVAGMLDIYLSNINIRTNEIMKVLTIVSTIFVPLTFISSLYGMNFDVMPELHYHWAYPAVLLVMATIAAGMLAYFRSKKWI